MENLSMFPLAFYVAKKVLSEVVFLKEIMSNETLLTLNQVVIFSLFPFVRLMKKIVHVQTFEFGFCIYL